MALANIVLPTPGTSSISRWPSDLVVFPAKHALDVVLQRVEPVGERVPVARLFPKFQADLLRARCFRLRHIVPLVHGFGSRRHLLALRRDPAERDA
jgi:hypothetical protein